MRTHVPQTFCHQEPGFDPREMGRRVRVRPQRTPVPPILTNLWELQCMPRVAFLPCVTECMTAPSPGKEDTTPNFTPMTTPSPNGYHKIFVIYSLTSH